jgi:hypothetical protein
MLWALGESRPDGLLSVEYPYFEGPGITFVETKTYVDHEGDLTEPESVEFNHGIGEIITALLRVGMSITAFDEHDSVPWQALGGDMMTQIDGGEWRLRERPERLAASYTLQATKH